ncbi:MAG: hypothetical protein O7H41_13620 [Planctomycetota bacterium]|nr:hypothetical protein [Planctomycetota bacterium]
MLFVGGVGVCGGIMLDPVPELRPSPAPMTVANLGTGGAGGSGAKGRAEVSAILFGGGGVRAGSA